MFVSLYPSKNREIGLPAEKPFLFSGKVGVEIVALFIERLKSFRVVDPFRDDLLPERIEVPSPGVFQPGAHFEPVGKDQVQGP